LYKENCPAYLTCRSFWGLLWVSQNFRYIAGFWVNRDSNYKMKGKGVEEGESVERGGEGQERDRRGKKRRGGGRVGERGERERARERERERGEWKKRERKKWKKRRE
jgi:hypothetical protein